MNDVKKDKFIEINYRGEYRLFIDDNIYDSSKFFYSVFQKSAELIREIHSCPEASDRDNCPYYLKDSEMPDTNNLIMYCADRGGGKSSAMLSFGNALKGIGSRSEEKKEGYEKFWEGMAGCRFAVLDAIDPTSLCEKEGIMTIILSRLFLEMRSDMQKNDREDQRDSGYRKVNEQSRYNIISKFRECYKYINVINGTSREFSDEEGDFSLEELAVLGDSSSFRKEFHNLVTLYLQNKYRTENISNDYLVIQIDDADLNTRKSYDILEDLRRYCMVPNVIILMAVNMPQMHQVVEQHFVREYDSLLRFSSGSSVFISSDAVKDMAVRYINKVMPAAHQIYLPKIDDFLRNGSSALTVRYMRPAVKNSREYFDMLSYEDIEERGSITDYQERIMRLIYMKTGIAMAKPDSYMHNFMPQNMRELTHFLSFMCSLPDLERGLGYAELFALIADKKGEKALGRYTRADAEAELAKRQANLDAFTQFFLNIWCDISLTKEDQKNMIRLSESTADTTISIARGIVSRYTGTDRSGIAAENNDRTDGDIPRLSADSLAELMRDINRITANGENSQDAAQPYKLAYALRLYLTIFLHREMLFSIERRTFSRFRRLFGCELWSPDYSRFTDYPLFGRFFVNYPVYRALYESNYKGRSAQDSDFELEDACYMNISGKTYFLSKDKIEKKASRCMQKLADGESCNAEIIFDLAFMMLNKVTTESGYDPKNPEMLHTLNKMLFVLLNWDVNHYVEMGIQRPLESLINKKHSSEKEWCPGFYSALSVKMAQLNRYLPLADRDNTHFIRENYVSDENIIFYSNPKTQAECLSSIISGLRSITRKAGTMGSLSDSSDIQDNNIDAVLYLYTDILQALQIMCSRKLSYIGQFSTSANGIIVELGNLMKAFYKLESAINEELGFSSGYSPNLRRISPQIKKSEKIKSCIKTSYGDILIAFNSWNEMIMDRKLEGSIINEINESFRLKQKGGDKQ